MYQAEKRSFRIHGRSTTIKLERPFWLALEEISWGQGLGLPALVTDLNDRRSACDHNPGDPPNLASCLRVYCLMHSALGGGMDGAAESLRADHPGLVRLHFKGGGH